MSNWSNNNLAQIHTWMALKVLAQSGKTFKDSENIKITDFDFWNSLDSDDMHATKANSLATQLDNIFRQFQGATYEDGINAIQAVNALSQILCSSDKTIADLAQVADENYRFAGELSQ